MKHFYSQNNFKQYRPYESRWQKFKKYLKKKPTQYSPDWEKSRPSPFKVRENRKKEGGWAFIFFPVVLLVWAGLVFHLPYFKIRVVESGNFQYTTRAAVHDYLTKNFLIGRKIFPKDNFFIINNHAIENDLKQNFDFAEVKIDKIFPNTVLVVIVEKPAKIVFFNGESYWLLNEEGKTIKKIGETAFEIIPSTTPMIMTGDKTVSSSVLSAATTSILLPKIPQKKEFLKEYYHLPLVTKARLSGDLDVKLIQNIIWWQENWPETSMGKIAYFDLPDKDQWVVITDKNFRVIAGFNEDNKKQQERLMVILKNEKPTEYVDLRFGEKIYWK